VHGAFRLQKAINGGSRVGAQRFAAQIVGQRRRHVLKGDCVEDIAVILVKHTKLGFAELRRIRKHGLEHRRQLAGRAADHAEHFRGCRLLLQGFPQLVQQPGVIDGDHRLARKAREQRDLLIGERADLPAIDRHHADHIVLLKHGHVDQSPDAADFDRRNHKWVAVEVDCCSRKSATWTGCRVLVAWVMAAPAPRRNIAPRGRSAANSAGTAP
jgi:hypothetical protein